MDAGSADSMEQLRALILSDGDLQKSLHLHNDRGAFAKDASTIARTHGIDLAADAIEAALSQDVYRLSGLMGVPVSAHQPHDGWLPVRIGQLDAMIDWAYFGERPFTAPFFEQSVLNAQYTPLNAFVQCRTHLRDLPRWTQEHACLAPNGFIFHMSRCGSTLVARMLASDPENIVISEASPIDVAIQILLASPQLSRETRAVLLRAVILALGHKRTPRQSRYFIKLDYWHTRAMALFRDAFPDVPWIFLYRDPAEVLASQVLAPGRQTAATELFPASFGLRDEDRYPPNRYTAAVLASICEGALDGRALGGGLMINYNQLPEALWTTILPHFGLYGKCRRQSKDARSRAIRCQGPRSHLRSQRTRAPPKSAGGRSNRWRTNFWEPSIAGSKIGYDGRTELRVPSNDISGFPGTVEVASSIRRANPSAGAERQA